MNTIPTNLEDVIDTQKCDIRIARQAYLLWIKMKAGGTIVIRYTCNSWVNFFFCSG
jgi:hypothetical protein